MVELTAKSPAHGLLPIQIGTCRLDEVVPDAITWVQVLQGGTFALPDPGATRKEGEATVLSIGPDQAIVVGAFVDPDEGVAVSDQTDAWAVLRLRGDDARDVLVRLTSIDLRPASFQSGRTARTLLGHMTASITATEEDTFEIMVFRSMAASAVHELKRAMNAVASRRGRKA